MDDLSFDQGVKLVDDYLDQLLQHLGTGEKVKNTKGFIQAYTAILRLSDE